MIVSKQFTRPQTAQHATPRACSRLVPTRVGRVARHTISTPKYQQSPKSTPGHDAAAARDTQQDSSNSRTILLAVDESPVSLLDSASLSAVAQPVHQTNNLQVPL